MKGRFRALDGLRGFAAISVVIFHLFDYPVLGLGVLRELPLIKEVVDVFSAGPNSVQILFVLSGFLIAYFYPAIISSKSFLQKRYTRIFPTLAAVMLFSILANSKELPQDPIYQLLLLLLISFSVRFFWIWMKKINKSTLNSGLFYAFVVLQVIIGIAIILINDIGSKTDSLSDNIIIFFGNVTLTRVLSDNFVSLSSVSWSLTTEILFYLFYPILTIPIVRFSKNIIIPLRIVLPLIIVGTLFIIAAPLENVYLLGSIMIGRASGFVVGVLAGVICLEKGAIFKSIAKLGEKRYTGIVLVFIFVCMQWSDVNVRLGRTLNFNNLYFFITSIIIALLILFIISSRNIFSRFLENKVLVFLGIISYPLYLMHQLAIRWSIEILEQFSYINQMNDNIRVIFSLFSLAMCILLSYMVYQLVDSLYFKKIAKGK